MPVKETRTRHERSLFLDVAPLRHVQTVQELPDILVADSANLLDVGGTLRYILEALRRELVPKRKTLGFPLRCR